MRLQEFLNDEEWQRFEQLIYASTWRALAAYQQQRATTRHVQKLAAKPTAKLKPQVAQKVKAFARGPKQPPHAAAPKPLPKPAQQSQAKAAALTAYRPIKTMKPLPATTRNALASAQPRTSQFTPSKTVQQVMPQPADMDQAARRMLPANKRGPNPIDLLNP